MRGTTIGAIKHGSVRLVAGLRVDVLVAGCVVSEPKAAEKLIPLHEAQLLTYLKLTSHHLGLFIGFNSPLLKDGLKRIVHWPGFFVPSCLCG